MAKTKTKRLTKRQLTMMRHRMRIIEVFLAALAVAVVFFNFILTVTGGWDDVNHVMLLLAPLVAVMALALALFDVVRYKAEHNRIIAPLVIVAITSGFYLIVAIVELILVTMAS